MSTIASGINAAGLIVGEYSDISGSHGFVYNPNGNTYTTLNDPAATNGTVAFGINDKGQVVGTYNTSTGTHSFLYSGEMYVNDDDPANGHTFAYDINNNGQIIGTLSDNTGIHGFIETAAPDPPPPPGTTADMILRHGADDLRNLRHRQQCDPGRVLARPSRNRLSDCWPRRFDGSDTTDMMLRSVTTGAFEVYDISDNNITAAANLELSD